MIKNFLKGILIGIAKITPGVSGSVLAISLNVYEKCLNILNKFYKIKTKEILFIFPIIIGVLTGILSFAVVLKYVYSEFYLFIILLFIGIIVGDVYKDISLNIKKDAIYYLIGILVVFSLPLFNIGPIKIESEAFLYIVLAIIESFTMIVPGISGTAVLMSLGIYDFYLSFITSLLNPVFFIEHAFEIFLYTLFLIISGYITIKITCIFLRLKSSKSIIRVIMFFTIMFMFKKALIKIGSLYEIILSIIILILGVSFSIIFNKFILKPYNKTR